LRIQEGSIPREKFVVFKGLFLKELKLKGNLELGGDCATYLLPTVLFGVSVFYNMDDRNVVFLQI